MSRPRLRWWKLVAIWIGFLLLHFSYDRFPNLVFRIIAEATETVFLHMKMLFVAYVAASLAEYALRRRAIRSTSTFLASRALVAVAYPWLAITLWFLAWALGVQLGRLGELIYANAMTLIGLYLALRLEEVFDAVEFRPALTWSILPLFAVAVFVYVSFSLAPPVHFFTTPPA